MPNVHFPPTIERDDIKQEQYIVYHGDIPEEYQHLAADIVNAKIMAQIVDADEKGSKKLHINTITVTEKRCQPYVMPFKEGEDYKYYTDDHQAERIFYDMRRILIQQIKLLSKGQADRGPMVAITYSANNQQAQAIMDGYKHKDDNYEITGSNQAQVFGRLMKKIRAAGLQDYMHILPIATSLTGGNSPSVTENMLKRDLANVALHMACGTVLVLQNQNTIKAGTHAAIGGGISVNFDQELSKACQKTFEKLCESPLSSETTKAEDENYQYLIDAYQKSLNDPNLLKSTGYIKPKDKYKELLDTLIKAEQAEDQKTQQRKEELHTKAKEGLDHKIPETKKRKLEKTEEKSSLKATDNVFIFLTELDNDSEIADKFRLIKQIPPENKRDMKNFVGYIVEPDPTNRENDKKLLEVNNNSLQLCEKTKDPAAIELQIDAIVHVLKLAIANNNAPKLTPTNPLKITPNNEFTQECFTLLVQKLVESDLPILFNVDETHEFATLMQNYNAKKSLPSKPPTKTHSR